MVMELKHVIEKLKKEGVEEAGREKAKIIKEAEQKADEIKKRSEKDADRIISEARDEAGRIRENSNEAIRQASRDLILSLREQLTSVFENVIKEQVASELGTEELKDIISKVAQTYVAEAGGDIEVFLSEKDREKVAGTMLSALKEKLSEGLEIKVDRRLKHGFKIGRKDGHSVYDFSDEAISAAFYKFLNPKIRDIIKTEGTGEDE